MSEAPKLLSGLFGFLRRFRSLGSGDLGLRLDLALDFSGAAFEFADVVEFCAANFTDLENVDLRDLRGREEEDPLDTYTVGHFTNVERSRSAAAAHSDAKTFVGLSTLFVAFFNADVNLHGVTGREVRKLRGLGAFFDEGDFIAETFLAFEETFRSLFTLNDDFRHVSTF